MRIFRTIIVLTGLAVLLPSPPEQPQPDGESLAGDVDLRGAFATATQAVSEVASFCTRQPGLCETAGYIAGRMEAKAKYSVKLLYEWANESGAAPQVPAAFEEAQVDPLSTGSAPALNVAAAGEGQSTLKLEDLIPEWRGPAKPRKG
jgi:hypothetical protein